MVGLEKASRGDGRGEVKGEAVEDFALLKDCGTKPGGARGLAPKRGEDDIETAAPPLGICHGAGDGRRKTVWRMGGGGDVALEVPSRYRHRTSRTAFSKGPPDNAVSFFRSSSSLSGLSSSRMLASCRIGRQASYVASETMFVRRL